MKPKSGFGSKAPKAEKASTEKARPRENRKKITPAAFRAHYF